MLKLMSIVLVAATIAMPCEAAPKRLKRVGEYSIYAGSVVMAILATYEGHRCRQRNGVEPCTSHYGSFAGTEAARFGVSLTFSGLSMYGHKAGYKEWFAPAAGMAAFNGYWAYRQAHTQLGEGEEKVHPSRARRSR